MRSVPPPARASVLVLLLLLLLSGCTPTPTTGKPVLVATYSVLGALVRDLAGDAFTVVVPMPNGLDPHEWEPSARDIEAVNHAALIVRNGLGLEGGLQNVLDNAQASGVPVFTASDHIAVRTVREGQGLPTGDADQQAGAQDPHLWLDPRQMKLVVRSLATELKSRFGTDLDLRATDLETRLDQLDAELRGLSVTVPAARRLIVTGHESLGYLADAYGFTLVGAIVPSLTTSAEVSAADLANLKGDLAAHPVPAVFSELGTPPKVAQALAREVGVALVQVSTHVLPPDGSYFTLLEELMATLVKALR
ncbi:MAG: metal ABC transporter substrate-binding protein [Spirochaetales bacterium]